MTIPWTLSKGFRELLDAIIDLEGKAAWEKRVGVEGRITAVHRSENDKNDSAAIFKRWEELKVCNAGQGRHSRIVAVRRYLTAGKAFFFSKLPPVFQVWPHTVCPTMSSCASGESLRGAVSIKRHVLYGFWPLIDPRFISTRALCNKKGGDYFFLCFESLEAYRQIRIN